MEKLSRQAKVEGDDIFALASFVLTTSTDEKCIEESLPSLRCLRWRVSGRNGGMNDLFTSPEVFFSKGGTLTHMTTSSSKVGRSVRFSSNPTPTSLPFDCSELCVWAVPLSGVSAASAGTPSSIALFFVMAGLDAGGFGSDESFCVGVSADPQLPEPLRDSLEQLPPWNVDSIFMMDPKEEIARC